MSRRSLQTCWIWSRDNARADVWLPEFSTRPAGTFTITFPAREVMLSTRRSSDTCESRMSSWADALMVPFTPLELLVWMVTPVDADPIAPSLAREIRRPSTLTLPVTPSMAPREERRMSPNDPSFACAVTWSSNSGELLVITTPAAPAVAVSAVAGASVTSSGAVAVPIAEPGAVIVRSPDSMAVAALVVRPAACRWVVPCGLTILPRSEMGPADVMSTSPSVTLNETSNGLSAFTELVIFSQPSVTNSYRRFPIALDVTLRNSVSVMCPVIVCRKPSPPTAVTTVPVGIRVRYPPALALYVSREPSVPVDWLVTYIQGSVVRSLADTLGVFQFHRELAP